MSCYIIIGNGITTTKEAALFIIIILNRCDVMKL
jgi:hypothetical protein